MIFTRAFSVAVLLVAASTIAVADDNRAFVDWARSRIAPIAADGKAFQALYPELAGVRLIGVGESVHESEPFLAFRSDLLKDLVRNQHVTALVLESGLPEVRAMDAYVRGRTATVDFNAALPGGHGPLLGIRQAMEWLREWNHGPGRDRPVSVYGADLPVRSGSMVPALDQLRDLLPGDAKVMASVDAVRPTANQVAHTWFRGTIEKYTPLPAETKAQFAADVTRLVDLVNRAGGSDAEALDWAKRMAFLVQQFEEMLRLGAYHPKMSRNRAMAENAIWVLGRLKPGERAVYWAHNAHIQRVPVKGEPVPSPGTLASTGSMLDATLGKRYYAIATAYGGPSRDKSAAPEEKSVDAALGSVASGPFLLTLRSAQSEGFAAWLSEERPMRFQVGSLMVPLGHAFDAVAYFDNATRAAPAQ